MFPFDAVLVADRGVVGMRSIAVSSPVIWDVRRERQIAYKMNAKYNNSKNAAFPLMIKTLARDAASYFGHEARTFGR